MIVSSRRKVAVLINVLAWLADLSSMEHSIHYASDAIDVFAAHRVAFALCAFGALVYADAVRLR